MSKVEKVTVPRVKAMKGEGNRIAMLTCYDYTMAKLVDRAGVDIILVGDSLGNVVLGYSTTLPVTMDDMIRHTAAVSRGTERALVVADLPFMSYQADFKDAVMNAGRFLQEAEADAVKLEGGREIADLIRHLTTIGIPVMGHLGLTPQSVRQFGGFRVQGRTDDARKKLMEDAKALEAAGVFSLVLESIPAELATEVTKALTIPTIGIGAGPSCDGQVLVFHDALGLFDDFRPKFVKQFVDAGRLIEEGVRAYCDEVKDGTFPGPEHSFK